MSREENDEPFRKDRLTAKKQLAPYKKIRVDKSAAMELTVAAASLSQIAKLAELPSRPPR